MIVRDLARIQARLGYLPRAELEALAVRLAVPLYRVEEVVSFFPHFRTSPPPEFEVAVCRDMACHLNGSTELKRQLDAATVGVDPSRLKICTASCLGRCDRAPAVRVARVASAVGTRPASSLSSGLDHAIEHSVKSWLGRTTGEVVDGVRMLATDPAAWSNVPDDTDLQHPNRPTTPWQIDVYAADGAPQPYEAVRQFIAGGATDTQRDEIIAALETAGLLGMGGAGGRAYKKWSEVRQAAGARKFVVCNADESEPGTFKDRELLLRTPHLVVEGVVLGGLVVGAERGYLYVRHEYEEQIAALNRAIEVAREARLCGDDILGSGISFDVEVFTSPGGYICGEQTALIEAMEDKRAEPRNRPPELQTNGLWDCPTLLNNVETLAWVPSIVLRDSGRWYAGLAVDPQYRGARFFSISGDVARPGVYEVPIGLTLRQLIDDHAQGLRDGRPLAAVALSGPSGGFLPAVLTREHFPAAVREAAGADATQCEVLDLPLDVALFRKMNLMVGAGIVIYARGADLLGEALSALRFFQAESCGKCVPCRIGTTKLVEFAEDLVAGRAPVEEGRRWIARDGKVLELALTMRQTAICGLGTVAANPLTSWLAYFSDQTTGE